MTQVGWRRLVAAFVWLGAVSSPALAAPLPANLFFRAPQMSAPSLSPSGRWVASSLKADGREFRQLVLIDLQGVEKPRVLVSFDNANVGGAIWITDERLMFSTSSGRGSTASEGMASSSGDGLFAINRDGKDFPRLLIRAPGTANTDTALSARSLSARHALNAVLRDGSNDVVVSHFTPGVDGLPSSVNLLRLDTVSGETKAIAADGPRGVITWVVDPATGLPRIAITRSGSKGTMHWRAAQDAPWTVLREFEGFGDTESFTPLHLSADNVLLAAARLGGADKSVLLRFNLNKDTRQGEELLALADYDFGGAPVLNTAGRLLGVRYLTDAAGTHWYDSALQAIQADVDKLLPDTVNVVDCGRCDRLERVAVVSWSDKQPTVYLVFDVASKKLSALGSTRPWIRPQAMAARDMVHFKARDGLRIPLHVTRPSGLKGPAPLVVLVHGGPYVRGGSWTWNPHAQFLASRGYAVIEPEFRGSTGFGEKHFRAGWKQWGLAMQDDIADAALFAVEQGWADAKRICIAGASYGGYATLMGLIKHPDLYRCGINWVGVSDIEMLYTLNWSDTSEHYRQHGMPTLVGDRVKDAAQLAATSPLKRAAELKQPLLMAYGALDVRVPLDHGLRMRDALRAHNKGVEWVVYEDEGHGFTQLKNNVDFWTRVEKFLERHLKNAQ